MQSLGCLDDSDIWWNVEEFLTELPDPLLEKSSAPKASLPKSDARRMKNRESARLSRLRRTEAWRILNENLRYLQEQNTRLRSQNTQLVSHNRKLIDDNRFLFRQLCPQCSSNVDKYPFCLPKIQ